MENVNKTKSFKSIVSTLYQDLIKYPMYLLSHPGSGYQEFSGKIYVAVVYIVLMMLAVIYKTFGVGFLINPNVDNNANVLVVASTVLLPTIVGAIANWCITALFDGKGTMKNIFMVIGYSFFPFVWLSIIATFASNFVVENEISYVTFIYVLAAVLTGYLLFFGLMGIHEYGLFKNIIMVIFTIVAIGVILFLCLLFLSFIEQILGWFKAVISEIKLRYF